jgi:hypothetical protein
MKKKRTHTAYKLHSQIHFYWFFTANVFPAYVCGISFLFPYTPGNTDKYFGKEFSGAYVCGCSFLSERIKSSKLAI